jgi:hypothetical protein
MFPISLQDLILIVASSLAVLGVISIASGIFLLVVRSGGTTVHSIASQATRLAQKGLAEEVAGLVGNASALVDAVNQLVRTSAGIGIFLVVFGFVMLFVSFWMAQA